MPRLIVRHGGQEIDVEPILAEAFAALPFVNPQHHSLFVEVFLDHWSTGVAHRTLLKSGLPDDFFVTLGGRTKSEAVEAIMLRASFAIYREAEVRREAKGGVHRFFSHAICVSDTHHTCGKARRLNGRIVPAEKRTAFPLPGCKADWCACSWRLMSDAEVRTRKR